MLSVLQFRRKYFAIQRNYFAPWSRNFFTICNTILHLSVFERFYELCLQKESPSLLKFRRTPNSTNRGISHQDRACTRCARCTRSAFMATIGNVCHVNNICSETLGAKRALEHRGKGERESKSYVPGRQSKKAGTDVNREREGQRISRNKKKGRKKGEEGARRVAPLCPSCLSVCNLDIHARKRARTHTQIALQKSLARKRNPAKGWVDSLLRSDWLIMRTRGRRHRDDVTGRARGTIGRRGRRVASHPIVSIFVTPGVSVSFRYNEKGWSEDGNANRVKGGTTRLGHG